MAQNQVDPYCQRCGARVTDSINAARWADRVLSDRKAFGNWTQLCKPCFDTLRGHVDTSARA